MDTAKLNRTLQLTGLLVLAGDYLRAAERPGGFGSGRWATICDPEAAESIP